MSARVHWETLRPGTKLRMTALGRQRLIMPWEHRAKVRVTTGRFVKYDDGTVHVLRDQHRTSNGYHPDFWEPR